MGRRRIDKRARRSELVDVALQLYLERPRAEVTVAAVAEAAGRTFWQVYHTVGAVEFLYRAAVLKLVDEIAAAIDKAPDPKGSVLQSIRAYTEHMVEVVEGPAYESLLYLLIRDGCGEPWMKETYEERIAGPIRAGLRSVVSEAGARQGAIVALKAGAATHFLNGLQATLAIPKLLPGYAPGKDRIPEQIVASLSRDVMAASYSLELQPEAA